MPKDLDEIEDMDVESSTTSQDAANEAEQSAELENANSSVATDETEADTLTVVRDVVDQREEEQAEAASSAEGEESGDSAGDVQELDNEGYTDVPFHKHQRFQDLIRERNELRDDATRYRNVQAFIDQNGLSGEEVALGFDIMAKMKTDPAAAWEVLQPLVKDVLLAAGEILPDDLAKRVESKELTKEAALEVSRLRAAEKNRAAREQFQQQNGQRQQQIEQGNSLRSTAQSWLNERRLKDPNFATKETRLHEKIAFLHATEGKPSDPAGVKAQLKKAYDAVNAELAQVPARSGAPASRPAAKRPIAPVRGGTVANAHAGKPKNTMDAIRQVVAARQNA
ncbi:hypothetical protein XM25_00620 [Devosia sp. H5989]|nr:hypothetical protein XM25_00620 [Devosia sp. H5989]